MATTIANLGAPAPTGNLLIVDGLNVAFRWKHQNILDFKYDYIRTIESLAKSYNAGTIIVCADGGSSYRKEIYPEYKANRKERFADQTEQEAKEFRAEGAEEAQKIRADAEKQKVVLVAESKRKAEALRGDGDALAIKIYSDSFGQDEKFFKFYRSMLAYENTFSDDGTTMLLSPDSDFFSFFGKQTGN